MNDSEKEEKMLENVAEGKREGANLQFKCFSVIWKIKI